MSQDTDPKRQKLIHTKEKWAREGRLLTGASGDPSRDRLPPGQREVRDWPVLDLGILPEIQPAEWELLIDGEVANPVRWDWEQMMAQPQVESVSDVHCVTAWSRFDNHWSGVRATHLIERVQPGKKARHVIFHAHDGYTTNVQLDIFNAEDVLLAHSWEGAPLTPEHGGPLRVVIPRSYFWKSAKWVQRIEFVADDRPGFWENRGYHNEADPWKEERYG